MININAGRLALFALTLAVCSACALVPMGGGARSGIGIAFMVNEPPRERVEVIPASPGDDYVWVKGNWERHGSDYAWKSGRWERPAAGFHSWIPAHWDHESRGWYFVEGHWA